MSDTSTNSEQKPGLLSTALKWLSVPATVVAGYFFGTTHVQNAAYDRAKRHNLIGSTPSKKRNDDGEIIKNTKGEVVYTREFPAVTLHKVDDIKSTLEGQKAVLEADAKATIQVAEKVAPLDKLAAEEITQGMERIGLGTLRKQWKFIHVSDKQEALMKAFTAAGITIGALLSIANSKTISNALSRKDAEKDTQIS